MVIKINLHPGGVPETGEVFSLQGAIVFPLDPGVSQGSTPGYYLSSLRDEEGETREFMYGGCVKCV
jgi:hypothetical protein